MIKLFLSYRRADSQHVTDRINDRLVGRFGEKSVFKDVYSIPIGADFREAIRRSIDECKVFLSVIGKQWIDITDDVGRRRLEDENDYVRVEIEAALARGIPIIPLLIDGANMPTAGQLPRGLQELSFRNAAIVRPDPDFSIDIDRIIRAIEQHDVVDLTAQLRSLFGNA